MNNRSLLKKYPKVKADILKDYRCGPDHFIANEEDPDLPNIRVDLPEYPEDWHKYDGFGLPAKEQKFQRQIFPQKLMELMDRLEEEAIDDKANKTNTVKLGDIWSELQDKQQYYREEIKWIKLQIYRVLNGYYLFQ